MHVEAFMMRSMALMLSGDDDGAGRTSEYNSVRGAKVIDFTRNLLDQSDALGGSKLDRGKRLFIDGALEVKTFSTITSLLDAGQFAGYTGPANVPKALL